MSLKEYIASYLYYDIGCSLHNGFNLFEIAIDFPVGGLEILITHHPTVPIFMIDYKITNWKLLLWIPGAMYPKVPTSELLLEESSFKSLAMPKSEMWASYSWSNRIFLLDIYHGEL